MQGNDRVCDQGSDPEKEQTGANTSFEFGRRNVVTRYYTTLVTRKNSKRANTRFEFGRRNVVTWLRDIKIALTA